MIWESEWADWQDLMNIVLWRDSWRWGWEDDAWAQGGVRLLPPWLVMAERSERWCQLLCFLSLENPWRFQAGCLNGEKFVAQLLLGWNYGPMSHICCDPPMRVSPDATHKQLLRLMMLTIAGSPLGMEYCWG